MQAKGFDSEEDSSSQCKDSLEGSLIESLKAQTGKGLLACEKWVNELKLSLAKIQPETLNKKLVDLKEKKYSHSDFINVIKEKFLLSSYETDEVYKKIRNYSASPKPVG